jgi:2-(1,2-epoxy-1,2-dihydrophenyl)acetyl-CoA isomerase
LNRPDKLNAFTGTMREDLLTALRACEDDADVRVVVITGAGRAFCAGGDVESMSGLQKSGDVVSFRKLLDAGRDVILQIATMRKPVIAAINGIAAGARCNLALACDYRIAAEGAKLSESFVRIGLHPDWGGTWLLPRLVGRSKAMEILMTGRMVDATEALAIGMIDRIASDLIAETDQFARTLAAAPIALAGIKRALLASKRTTFARRSTSSPSTSWRAFARRMRRKGWRRSSRSGRPFSAVVRSPSVSLCLSGEDARASRDAREYSPQRHGGTERAATVPIWI